MSVRNGSRAAYHPVEKRIAGSTLLLSLIVSGGVAFAQIPDISHPEASRPSIEGMVKLADQQNQAEPVPGVPLTLTSSSTGESLAATTDAEGRFQIGRASCWAR